MNTPDFNQLRDQWALKHSATTQDIEIQMRIDQQANPHNEPYANKKPRRSDAQLVSDLAYTFADGVLRAQYGHHYEQWLAENCKEVWHVMKHR